MSIVEIGKEFIKPPRKILGLTFCRHVWKKYWRNLEDGATQVELERCARCLKDKDKNMGRIV